MKSLIRKCKNCYRSRINLFIGFALAFHISPNTQADEKYSWEVVLRWLATPGATKYLIQVSQQESFSTVLEEIETKDTQWIWLYRHGMENANGRVFYRVAAIGQEDTRSHFSKPMAVEIPKEVLPPLSLRLEAELECAKLSKYHESNLVRFENNNKDFESCILNGETDGPYGSWYSNGNPKTKGAFKGGKPHAFWTRWHENGNIRDQGNWTDGVPDGRWAFYNSDGSKKSEVLFKNGQRCARTLWPEKKTEILFPCDLSEEPAQRIKSKRRLFIVPRLGPSMHWYQQTNIENYNQLSLTGQISGLYGFSNGPWMLSGSLESTLVVVGSNQAGISARFFNTALNLGYSFPTFNNGWGISLFGGVQYFSAIATNDLFGFKVYGPQLYPIITKEFDLDRKGYLHFKFVPLSKSSSASDLNSSQELSLGAGYELKLGLTPVAFQFEASSLQVNFGYKSLKLITYGFGVSVYL